MGSLAGIGLIAAVIVWYIMKKKRAGVAPANTLNSGYPDPNTYPKYEHAPPISPGPISPQMLYNPSDPSTFPTAVHDPSSFGGGSAGYPQTTSHDPNAQWRGHYSGAPEV